MFGCFLQGRLALQMPLDLLTLDQLAVGAALLLILLVEYHAIPGHQLRLGHFESFRRQLQQDGFGLSGSRLQGGTKRARRHRAVRPLVPWAAFGIAHDDLHGIQRRLQFFGQHLRQRGDRPLAHLDLARETGHPAILADPQKGIEVGGCSLAPAPLATGFLRHRQIAQRDKDKDAGAQSFQKLPPALREELHVILEIQLQVIFCGHIYWTPFISPAALWMASMIRVCAPQRQRFWSMPRMICSRVGLGFFDSRPTAVSTMPGVQNPHCKASCSMNAFCTGCSAPALARPSMVTTSLSLTVFTLRKHERTGTPSSSTVQEPQCPSPQPNLVPVSPRSVRSTQSSRRSPSTFSRTGLSLSLKAIVSVMRFSSLLGVAH